MTAFAWRACCEAGADRGLGRYVEATSAEAAEDPSAEQTPASPDTLPKDPIIALHEAAHALYLHGIGCRIVEAKVGLQNFVRRAPADAMLMSDFDQIVAALAGDIGARYASRRLTIVPSDAEIDTGIDRVRSGCGGTCDDCSAGRFAIHLAGTGAAPEVAREVWRLADRQAVDLLTTPRAYSAIHRLGDALLEAGCMDGEAVHVVLEPLLPFGAWLPTDAA